MRKIIGGKAYDTDTATLVADCDYGDEPSQAWWRLYQTRAGAWFEVAAGHDGVVEEFVPRTEGEAHHFLERHANHLVEKYFGEAPEASSEDILSGRVVQASQAGAGMSSPAPSKDSTTGETSSPPQPKEMLTLKPTFMGLSLDLKELFRRVKAWWKSKK